MDPSTMKVTELKAQLKKRGLAVGGLKKELIDRLNEALAAEANPAVESSENATVEDAPEDKAEEIPEPAIEEPPVPAKKPSPVPEPAPQPVEREDTPEALQNPPSSDSTPRLEDITTEIPVEEPEELILNGVQGETKEEEVMGDILPEELRAKDVKVTKDITAADKMDVDNEEVAKKVDGEDRKIEVSTAVTLGRTAAQTVPADDVVMADPDTTEQAARAEVKDSVTMNEEEVRDAMDITPDPADARKRKRRSVTPPPPAGKEEPEAKKVRQEEPAGAAADERGRSRSRSHSPRRASASNNQKPDVRFRALFQPGAEPKTSGGSREEDGSGRYAGDGSDAEDDIPPASHPATRAIYIENLMRPLKENELTSYLTSLACKSDDVPSSASIESFYLDSIKTHAFVVFKSISEATRVRSRLHNRVWPKERDRKQLKVDFFPEELFNKWVDMETAGGSGRSRTTKWKVNYIRDDDGEIRAELEDAAFSSNSGPPPRSSTFGGAAFAPPTGPRLDRERRAFEERREAPRGEMREQDGRKVKVVPIEELFLYTKTKPRLYYLPVKESVARERLQRRDEMQKNGRRYGRAF